MQDPGSEDELASWIRLQLTPGVGPAAGRRLLSAFGPPGQIFRTDVMSLRSVVPEQTAAALAAPATSEIAQRLAATLEWAAKPGNHVITLDRKSVV